MPNLSNHCHYSTDHIMFAHLLYVRLDQHCAAGNPVGQLIVDRHVGFQETMLRAQPEALVVEPFVQLPLDHT